MITVTKDEFVRIGVSLVDAVVASGFAKSKSEARRAIEQGSINLEGKTITDINARLCHNPETNEMFLLTVEKMK